MAWGEFSGFGDFSSGVEGFWGVDIDEADASGIGFFEVFFGEDRHWRIFGDRGFFDRSPWRCFAFGHCVGEVGDPLFTWINGVERVENAFSAGDYGGRIIESVGYRGGCHCGYQVSRYERMVAGYDEAERGG